MWRQNERGGGGLCASAHECLKVERREMLQRWMKNKLYRCSHKGRSPNVKARPAAEIAAPVAAYTPFPVASFSLRLRPEDELQPSPVCIRDCQNDRSFAAGECAPREPFPVKRVCTSLEEQALLRIQEETPLRMTRRKLCCQSNQYA